MKAGGGFRLYMLDIVGLEAVGVVLITPMPVPVPDPLPTGTATVLMEVSSFPIEPRSLNVVELAIKGVRES